MAGPIIASTALASSIGSKVLGESSMFKTSYVRSFKSKTIKIIAPCNIIEHVSDQFVITDHPTEKGTLMSDHMYALPKRVDVELIYSVSGGYNLFKQLGSYAGIAEKPKTLQEYYDQFLMLQASKSPFDITTGKRKFKNMLIESIENLTDDRTENLLSLVLRCREVMIVKSKRVDPNNQKDPANTSAPVSQGKVQPTSTSIEGLF